jgi:hypothetical protein
MEVTASNNEMMVARDAAFDTTLLSKCPDERRTLAVASDRFDFANKISNKSGGYD